MNELFESFLKYNFWDGHIPTIGFRRDLYLDKILKFRNNSLIKVITGQRRTGKSYILRQIAAKFIEEGVPPENIFLLNKEFIEFDNIRDYKDLEALIKQYHTQLKPKGKVYLFIDEIQNIGQWERIVNSYAQNPNNSYEIFISGSNSKMLAGELATLLSGRYVNFEVFPFSYLEFLGINQFTNDREAYMNYMATGGLPQLYSLPDDEARFYYVSALKDTILFRDIVQRYSIKDPNLLIDLFIYLINTASNLMSVNNVSNYFKSKGRKSTYDTVSNYLGYLQDTFLVHKAERIDISGKEVVAGNVKYYINDLAFRNYLFTGFSYGLGYQLENLIYLELRRFSFQVYVGVLPNKEVDFVARKNDRTIYVQCAYSLADEETAKREYAPLLKINDHYEKLIVTLDEMTFPANQGIRHIQAWNFNEYLSKTSELENI